MRLGVIDCGTNTFHILIAENQDNGTFHTLYKEREYVRLGQEGIDNIGSNPFQRGVDCIARFKEKLDEQGVEKWMAFGTETLRRASNSQNFVEKVFEETGVDIKIISGEEEARLIHLGVMQAVPAFKGKSLIMDIGGGSVEFIIADQEKVHWAQSFPIGVQVLFSGFQKNDPISTGDLLSIEYHLDEILKPLLKAVHSIEAPFLIGASGSFEVLESFLVKEKPHPLYSIIGVQDFYGLYYKMMKTKYAERLNMSALPTERAELIVVAFVLIDYVIRKGGIRQIITSAYAMKEGIMREMIEV